MNILLITDSYPPEIRAICTMTQQLAQELCSRGHDVWVVTSWPKYNLADDIAPETYSEFSLEGDIRVIRVKSLPHHKVNFILRGIAELLLPHLFHRKIKKYVSPQLDAVIAYTPPLPLAILAAKIKKSHRARYLLNVQDIFPQNAIDLGILKNRFLIRIFERMEQRAYKAADHITSHTTGCRWFLIEKKNVPADKITMVPNWIDVDAFDKAKATGLFRKKFGVRDKFVFLFPGTIGPSQDIDFLVDVAARVADTPEICFLLVGDGVEKPRLEQLVRQRGLKNVRFYPFVSEEQYPDLVKDANVGLACLSNKNSAPVVPGKILGFMAASVPVLAFLNCDNDGHKLIKDANCGYSACSDNLDEAAGLVRKLFSEKDTISNYGKNGYDYVITHFSKKACIDTIEKFIK